MCTRCHLRATADDASDTTGVILHSQTKIMITVMQIDPSLLNPLESVEVFATETSAATGAARLSYCLPGSQRYKYGITNLWTCLQAHRWHLTTIRLHSERGQL